MVLEKDSSVLGYPGEISRALDADHHNVCKYWSPQDPNYITVRNVLKSLVSKIISKNNGKRLVLSDRRASLDLKTLLAISETPAIDYIFYRDLWTQGTNDWILAEKAFSKWRDPPESTHRLLWLSGGAATGKSVMSAFIVNGLVEEGLWCQYFFIRFGDREKRTLSLLLRSLAYQLALCVPGLLEKLVDLVNEAINFETVDPRVIWDRMFKSIIFKWKESRPLYWVIDGLDEAEDPRAVVKLLSDISSSSVPIRILFTGRRTNEIMTAFERLPQESNFEIIKLEGHVEDLRRHIRKDLSVPGGAEFKSEIEQRILEGSHDNFLVSKAYDNLFLPWLMGQWVRLAVDKVNQCYTRADVDMALQEFPEGMEAIYDRMGSTIANNPKPSAKARATSILQCVTCSLRMLKLAELLQALGWDASEVLDLQRAITDFCGGFVIVDNGGNVTLIHQSAREYLLGDPDKGRSFKVDQSAAHKQMFLSSMRYIMSPGLRARLSRKQELELLDYAVSSWSSHLISTPVHDHETMATLKEFLIGSWVLTWIHTLAISRQLRVLIGASKDLSRFISRETQEDPGTIAKEKTFPEQDLFESWAVDLLRIVGKFSNVLRRKPDSIYKFIPPLCPKSSSIYQQFGKTEAKNLSVSGLSAEIWDDSLARIPLGHAGSSIFASSITAAGSQLAILASTGNVFFYDSSDFMEARNSPIKHGERVDKMQMNSTATLLVTYGYHTTKVWEISTGKCKVSVESIASKTRPLAMLFKDNNATLLVATDDRRVRSLNLNESLPEWDVVAELEEQELEGRFMIMGSATHVALSKDGSMVAIAYRSHPLSAWETDGPVHIGHCWRKDQETAIRELRELVWHPHLPQLLGLNLEGDVIKWAPYDDTIDELPESATKLTISADGDLFATGDGYGRVKIYTTSTFSLVYQLAAQDAVFGLTFSPDSRRLYDIRGYYANAWEPYALTRLAEQSRKHLDSESESLSLGQSPGPSVAISRVVDSITALAGSPQGRSYCCGTERGVVSLHDTQRGKLMDLHVSSAKFAIEKIIWSGDGKYICFTNSSKQITVMSVTQVAKETNPVVEQRAVIPMRKVAKGAILQLLFHADSKHLLVHSSSHIYTVSLSSSTVVHSCELDDTQIQWILHPRDPALIVGFGPDTIDVFDWDLVKRHKYQISWPLVDPSNEPNIARSEDGGSYQFDRVLVTQDKRHLFLQMSHSKDHSLEKQFFFFETTAISTTFPQAAEDLASPHETEREDSISQSSSISLSVLSTDLSSKTAVALAFLSRDRLVFLSKSFTICSAHVPWSPFHLVSRSGTTSTNTTTASRRPSARGTGEDTVQEHFALPGDWISTDCLLLSSIWGIERSLLCPRNGEAAVVKCAALA